MSFQDSSEDSGPSLEADGTRENSCGDPSSCRQDDATTGSNRAPDDGSANDGHHPSPRRDYGQVRAMLEATPQEFSRIIEGESRERLAKPASDGDWGVVEILPHIADWEEVAAFWTGRILREETPVLEAVDDSLWAIEHDYASEDPYQALERFAALRLALVETLQGINDDDWQRSVIHAAHGRITLHQFADRICDHDARYLAQAHDALS
ncbi:MAG: DinB family protein [Chloroflexota bacterium]|nr:DinB family protein [Chloroflexota bacterium]